MTEAKSSMVLAGPSDILGRIRQYVCTYSVQSAFLGSVLLSLVAYFDSGAINRDGALYVHAAQQFNEHGFSALTQIFNWPWFSLLIAFTSRIPGLTAEAAAYLWCALFMAGTCALLVALVRARIPRAGAWAVLIVLAIPAYNELRDDILREYGFWFFSVLALWLFDYWRNRGGWLLPAATHVTVLAAAAFRLEAVVITVALGLAQLYQLRFSRSWLPLVQYSLLPGGLAVAAAMLLAWRGMLDQARVTYYLQLTNLGSVMDALEARANHLMEFVLSPFIKDDAVLLLSLSLFLLIVIKAVKLSGPIAFVFVSRASWSGLRESARFPYVLCALALYLAVLFVFLVQTGFVVDRYISFLHLLAVPLLVASVHAFASRRPKLGRALMVLMLLQMVANVVSSGTGKTHYVTAGQWLGANFEQGDAFFFEDGRVAHYAGWGYPGYADSLQKVVGDDRVEQYDYFVIDADTDQDWLARWMQRSDVRVLKEFDNGDGDALLIIGR